jgi:hypothetical protein
MSTTINFGPPVPPMEDRGIGRVRTLYTRREDDLEVQDALEDVAHRLATEASWPGFTETRGDTTRRVYVNPSRVRYVTESEDEAS